MVRTIQYIGLGAYSYDGLLSIYAILSSGALPKRVTIISVIRPADPPQGTHLFLFWDWGHFKLTIVPDGFTSGYVGTGPKAFSLAICMIRSKKIAIDEVEVPDHIFNSIKKRQASANIFKEILAAREELPFPFYDYVLQYHEELLERGKIWKEFHWCEEEVDQLTEAVSNIDDYDAEIGKKLRRAIDKIRSSEDRDEWQQIGLLMRDSWILLMQKLCKEKSIDTSNIGHNDVKAMLGKLKLEDEILGLSKSAYALCLKIQHDRNITRTVAQTCIVTTITLMQTILYAVVLAGRAGLEPATP